jgi:hypothetical protein
LKNVSPKVAMSTLAAAIVTILVWCASLAGVEVPELVSGALITLIVAIAGYFTIDPRRS